MTEQPDQRPVPNNFELATLGGGCFWCLEAVYLDLRGIQRVVSGYAGGSVKDPTYRQVCSGNTGSRRGGAAHL